MDATDPFVFTHSTAMLPSNGEFVMAGHGFGLPLSKLVDLY
jgi:hypothetical protein